MDEMVITTVWMGGVVAMMLVFAVIAVVGLYKQKNHKQKKSHHGG